MPYTTEMALNLATARKTRLAASKLRLFQSSFAPNVNSLKAAFVTAEATYDGYTAGGVTVTAFSGPFSNPAGGASIVSPNEYFAYVPGDDLVQNVIGGWWIEDSTGKVDSYDVFPDPVPMASVTDAIPLVITLTEGRNAF